MTRRLLLFVFLAVAIAMVAGSASAYERYNDGCTGCHGAFDHTMHTSPESMGAACGLCHTISGTDVLGSSDGTPANVGYGCVGCHGRLEDAGNDSMPGGLGAGLRQHHDNSGIPTCSYCHSDADPGNYTPVGEDVFPPYYGTVDTWADEPCNSVASALLNENWDANFVGLDNDGDGLYDADDVTDCPEPNGTLMLAIGALFLGVLHRRR